MDRSVSPTSSSRCGHVVRDEFGVTFPTLIDGRRLEQARRQLLATIDPVALVARRCGYTSASYFAKRFRQAVGQSPDVFRQAGGA
jgi:AraC-like DNA-binding protein